MQRRGLGIGKGKGYYNLVPKDPYIHSLSAKGIKTKISLIPKKIALPKIKLNAYKMQPIETYEEGDYKVEIYPDEFPQDPREWDNLGNMLCFHKEYNLGDKTDLKAKDFNNWNEIIDYLQKEKNAKVILPLYLYDHSGLRMKVGSFSGLLPEGHAEFDTGKVGFIYATEEDIKKKYGVKKITKPILEKVEKELMKEVEIYDKFLSGDVYGYRVTKKIPVVKVYPDGTQVNIIEEQEIDSLWGFYDINEAIEQGKNVLKSEKNK